MDLHKKLLDKILKKSFYEPAEVFFWDGTSNVYGEGEPKFKITFHKDIAEDLLDQDPTLALAESYMDGNIDIDGDIQKLIESFYMAGSDSFIRKGSKVVSIGHKFSKSKKGTKNDIQYHYDIGNDFYRLWLDDSMTYSCGYFKNKDDSLNDAQKNKVELILKKLQLEKGQTLLDIGCGWGELILTAAKNYGVKSYGVTLSEEQYAKVKSRIKEEGLEELVSVELKDYRDIKDMSFDRIVSVGMIEHIGKGNLNVYFSQVNKLLKDGGVSMVHSITMPNDGADNTFLNKYIFPGGYVHGVKQLISEIAENGFHILDVESLRRHYGRTLEHWETNFENNIGEIGKTKNENFIRMWRLFLAGCAASFYVGNIDLHQIIFSKGANNDLVLTRDSIYD